MMGRLLALVALLAGPALATYSEVQIDFERSCVQVRVQMSSTGGEMSFRVDTDNAASNGVRTRVDTSTTVYRDSICGLQAATKYYVYIDSPTHGVFACSSICTDCDLLSTGNPSTGINCDATGEHPNFMTAATFAAAPVVPRLPIHAFDPTALCDAAIDTTRTVSCTANVATDFPTQVAAAAALNSDQFHEILIPGGCKIQEPSGYTLPNRSGAGAGAGGIIITTAGDAKLFPPDGGKIDPGFMPVLAELRSPANRTSLGDDGNAPSPYSFAVGADRYCFKNLALGFSPPEDVYVTYTITGSSGSVLTISGSVDAGHHANDQAVVDCTAGTGDGWQGRHNVSTATGSSITVTDSPAGSCTAGTVTFSSGVQIQAVSTGGVVDFVESDHGFVNFPAKTVTAFTDPNDGTTTLTVSTQHLQLGANYVTAGDVIEVEGSGDSALDGKLCEVTSAAATTITVSCDPTAVCASGCGTYREHQAVVLDGTADSAINTAVHYDVVDRNSIQLLDPTDGSNQTIAGALGAGGWGSFDPETPQPFFAMKGIGGTGGDDVALYQTVIDTGGFPARSGRLQAGGATATSTSGFAVIGSWLLPAEDWCIVDPITGAIRPRMESASCANLVGNTAIFSYNNSSDYQFVRNTVDGRQGIPFQGDFGCYAGSNPQNFTIARSYFHIPDSWIPGSSTWTNGRYTNHRHWIEFKCGRYVLIEGNYFDRAYVDGESSGTPIIFKNGSSHNNVLQPSPFGDFTIEGNIFESIATGPRFLRASGTELSTMGTQEQNVLVQHNLFNVEYIDNIATPAQSGQSITGMWFNFLGAWQDVNITRNTLWRDKCRGVGCILSKAMGLSARTHFNNNIFVHSQGTWEGLHGDTNSGFRGYIPASTGGGLSLWQGEFVEVGANGTVTSGGDPNSEFDGNVIVGGLDGMSDVANESDAAYATKAASTAAADNFDATEVAAYYSGFGAGNVFPAGTSLNARLDTVFEAGTFQPKSAYLGKGADPAMIARYRGTWGPVMATVGATSLTVTYDGPLDREGVEEACAADVSTDRDFSVAGNITRWTDAAGAGARTHQFTGLATATVHYWRVMCSTGNERGQATTGS